MTDITHARESAIAAETRAEALFASALERWHELNQRLLQLHDEIKAAQPVSNGAVCLELYSCGKDCLGCPHGRWVQYHWTRPKPPKPAMLIGINLSAKGKDPVLALSRKNNPRYKEAVDLIREAKAILDKRAKLIDSLRPLRYATPKA